MNKSLNFVVLAVLCAVIVVPASWAAGVKYQTEDGKYIKLGGRIQLQYHVTDPEEGSSTDELIFRRFRPYIEGSIHEDWKGKFQWDMGKGDVELKDAYFKYSGFDFMSVTLGNANFPFSRELLTSSKKQQLVERTFVGDHNYGTPDRQAGIHLAGDLSDKLLTWNLSAAKGALDPSNSKLDFDTIISLKSGDDWIEGDMVGGRLELFPMGYFKPEQGDFKREMKVALGVAAFAWNNDGDGSDVEEGEEVDDVMGVEVSAALRGGGFSIDAQFNSFDSELKDAADGIDGIYESGETTLENAAIEGGFMVVPDTLEVVGGYQVQDADGYAESWTRTSVGVNYFVKKHDIKYQLTYRVGENKDGEDGADVDEVFVQAQYVF